MTREAITAPWLENVPPAAGFGLAWRGSFAHDELAAELIAEAPTQRFLAPLFDLIDELDGHGEPDELTPPDADEQTPPGEYAPVGEELLERVRAAMLRKWDMTDDDIAQWRDRFAC